MGKKIILEGFMITPIMHLLDTDTDTSEPWPVGQEKVTLAELPTWAEFVWPVRWTDLRQQQETNEAVEAAAKAPVEEAPPNRASRRAKPKAAAA